MSGNDVHGYWWRDYSRTYPWRYYYYPGEGQPYWIKSQSNDSESGSSGYETASYHGWDGMPEYEPPFRSRGPSSAVAAPSSAVAAPSSASITTPIARASSSSAVAAPSLTLTHVEPVSAWDFLENDAGCSEIESVQGDTAYEGSETDPDEDTETKDARREIDAQQQHTQKEQMTAQSVMHGSNVAPRAEPSKKNLEPEVGNFGLYHGNWGIRATGNKNEAQRKRTEQSASQILKNPGIVTILVEASEVDESMLRNLKAQEGTGRSRGVADRPTYEHWVVRANEKSGVLIAARKNNTSGLVDLFNEIHQDHPYLEKGKKKMAVTRTMIAKVTFKQNIGHLGRDIVVCGVHGHNRTMKLEWPQVWKDWWDEFARRVQHFGIQFLAGDFNMSLTEVCKQLRQRQIHCDCVSWCPWLLGREVKGQTNDEITTTIEKQRLGFDSCGIFYIGGQVEVIMDFGFSAIEDLIAVAEDRAAEGQANPQDFPKELLAKLPVFEGMNYPGQLWPCYRSEHNTELPHKKDLRARLMDLLSSSTTPEERANIQKRHGASCKPWLKLKGKGLKQSEWLVEGEMHQGSHFPLVIFTDNEGHRSAEAESRRKMKRKTKSRQRY